MDERARARGAMNSPKEFTKISRAANGPRQRRRGERTKKNTSLLFAADRRCGYIVIVPS